jgi:hypothetical protein
MTMALISWPKRVSKANLEPAPEWDHELVAMQRIGEWLGQLTEPQQLRVLAYFMWRLKSEDRPRLEEWVESVAEQSAVDVSRRYGFKESAE